MTRVTADLRKPMVTGVAPAEGLLVWQPTRRYEEETWVVVPEPFKTQLVAGLATAEVEPNGPDWCWKITERVDNKDFVRYVAVPDVPVAFYTELIDVDPATLEPNAEPVESWYAYVDGLALSAEQARTSALAAQSSSSISAQESADSAASANASRVAAETAEQESGQNAEIAESAALAAQEASETSASSATEAKVQAQQSAESSTAAQLFVEHLAVTANPDDPDCVTLHFPSWRYAPGDTDAIQLTIGVEVP